MYPRMPQLSPVLPITQIQQNPYETNISLLHVQRKALDELINTWDEKVLGDRMLALSRLFAMNMQTNDLKSTLSFTSINTYWTPGNDSTILKIANHLAESDPNSVCYVTGGHRIGTMSLDESGFQVTNTVRQTSSFVHGVPHQPIFPEVNTVPTTEASDKIIVPDFASDSVKEQYLTVASELVTDGTFPLSMINLLGEYLCKNPTSKQSVEHYCGCGTGCTNESLKASLTQMAHHINAQETYHLDYGSALTYSVCKTMLPYLNEQCCSTTPSTENEPKVAKE